LARRRGSSLGGALIFEARATIVLPADMRGGAGRRLAATWR
jgi:hypothetical protein